MATFHSLTIVVTPSTAPYNLTNDNNHFQLIENHLSLAIADEIAHMFSVSTSSTLPFFDHCIRV